MNHNDLTDLGSEIQYIMENMRVRKNKCEGCDLNPQTSKSQNYLCFICY